MAQLIGRKYLNDAPGIDSMGIWQCSPGRWRRTIMQEEFAHFLSGSARFIPDSGEAIDIQAGDTIWFPKDSRGVWEIGENVRKVYVIIDRPSVWKRCKAQMKMVLARWLTIQPERPQHLAPAPEVSVPSYPRVAARQANEAEI